MTFNILPLIAAATYYLLLDRALIPYLANTYTQYLESQAIKARRARSRRIRPIDSANTNTLYLLSSHICEYFEPLPIDFQRESVYTADCESIGEPHIRFDLNHLESLSDALPPQSIDKILIPVCFCCTQDVITAEILEQIIRITIKALKIGGKVYLKHYPSSQVSMSFLNELGLHCSGVDYHTSIDRDWLHLVFTPPHTASTSEGLHTEEQTAEDNKRPTSLVLPACEEAADVKLPVGFEPLTKDAVLSIMKGIMFLSGGDTPEVTSDEGPVSSEQAIEGITRGIDFILKDAVTLEKAIFQLSGGSYRVQAADGFKTPPVIDFNVLYPSINNVGESSSVMSSVQPIMETSMRRFTEDLSMRNVIARMIDQTSYWSGVRFENLQAKVLPIPSTDVPSMDVTTLQQMYLPWMQRN